MLRVFFVPISTPKPRKRDLKDLFTGLWYRLR